MGNAGSSGQGEGVVSTVGDTLAGVGTMLPFPLSLGAGLGGTAVKLIGKLVGDDPVVAQEAFSQILQQNPQLAQQLQVLPQVQQQPPAIDNPQALTTYSQPQAGQTGQSSNPNGGVEAFLGHLKEANRLQNLGPFTHAPTQQNQQVENLLSLLGQGQLTKPTMGQVPTTTQTAPNMPLANRLGKTQLTADVAEQHYVNPIQSAITSGEAQQIGSNNPLSTFAKTLQQNWFPQANNTLKTLENQNINTNIPKPVGPGVMDTSNLSMAKPGTSTSLPTLPVSNGRAINQLNALNTTTGDNSSPNVNTSVSTVQAQPESLGSILKDTALDAANQGAKALGTMAGSYLKENAGSLVKKGISFLGKTIGGLFRGKLVGDAPLQPGTWAPGDYSHLPQITEAFQPGGFGNNVIKMIGDAPADGVMNDEEATSAVRAMATSITITLFAKLVIIEQTLETALPMIFSNSLRQAAAQVARQITVQNGMVRLSQLLFNSDLVGSYYEYDGTPMYKVDAKQYIIASGFHSLTYTGLVPVSDAPPLLGNVTYEALKPLLSGAPASEYPSTLRIKTRRTDIDALLTIASQGGYELTASSGYSFVAPLCKLLGYQSAAGQLPGDEFIQYASGVYPIINFSKDPERDAALFPWENGSQDIPGQHTWKWLKVAWVTYTEFADAVVGMRAPWQDEFLPINWGNECAVIFLSRSEMQDGGTTIVRILSQIAYPFCLMKREMTWVQADGQGFTPPFQDSHGCWPHLYSAGIQGPKNAILFVITDLSDRSAGFVTVGVPTAAGQGTPHVLTDAVTPNDPWIAAGDNPHEILLCMYSVIDNFGKFSALIQAEIRRWESMYGNNSDRSSAMRWAAENCARFGQPKNFAFTPTGTLNVYTGYTYNGDPNKSPFGDLGKVFIEPNSVIHRIQYAMMLGTTPLMITPNMNEAGKNAKWADYINFSTTHFIGQQDPVVEFLVERGMVSPAEEYPTVRFTLPPKNFSAITELAQLMAFTMDSSAQARSVTVKDFYSYPNGDLNDDANQTIITRMALEKGFFPIGQAICSNGIQKPSFSVNYQSLETSHNNPIFANAVKSFLGEGIVGPNNTTVGIFGRVPWSLAERWHPSFSIRDTNTNVYGLDVKITEHLGVNGYSPNELTAMLSCDYDVQFIASLFRASKFLAGLMVTSLQVNNPLWLFDRSSNYFYFVAGATTPMDSVVARIVVLSEAVGVIQVPNFNLTPLPICGFLPTYNIAGGGRKLRLAAIQPVDSFVNPGGSNDYQLFYPVRTQSSLRTTIGYHEFGHPLFSDSTANNPFAY